MEKKESESNFSTEKVNKKSMTSNGCFSELNSNTFGTAIKNKLKGKLNCNNYSTEICNDVLIEGYIIRKKNKLEFLINKAKEEKTSNRARIVIVLESPHKAEYSSDIAPARGATGAALNKHFLEMIRKYYEAFNKDYSYEVILMNAVQYQCSLGQKPSIYRDRMWLYCWHVLRGDINFSARLKHYNPDIIFNLCTRFDHHDDELAPRNTRTLLNRKYIEEIDETIKEPLNCTNYKGLKYSLKGFVHEEICKYKAEKDKEHEKSHGTTIFYGSHPASWRKKEHRIINIYEDGGMK